MYMLSLLLWRAYLLVVAAFLRSFCSLAASCAVLLSFCPGEGKCPQSCQACQAQHDVQALPVLCYSASAQMRANVPSHAKPAKPGSMCKFWRCCGSTPVFG